MTPNAIEQLAILDHRIEALERRVVLSKEVGRPLPLAEETLLNLTAARRVAVDLLLHPGCVDTF